MINKVAETARAAIQEISHGATVLISGFGEAGSPTELIHALIDANVRDLIVVNNNAGNGHVGLAALIEHKRVRKVICSFPRSSNSEVFNDAYRKGEIELEVVPQGTLAERLRSAGAGVPAFYTQTGVGTVVAEGKETREFDGKSYVLERALHGDFALVKAARADRVGNLVYNKTARNFGPVMCSAARTTIVQVKEIVEPGEIDPETVVTPGIFVSRMVEVRNPVHESELIATGVTYP
jgi:3-oxoadipate CoA-transferase alpha subunit